MYEHGRGEYLTTPAGRVWFEVEGAGPVVVLVPGGPGAGHAHYHPWFSALAEAYTLVYVDQLGTGRSDRLADARGYTVGLYTDTLERLLDHLAVDRAHLIGISFGGMAAADLAARRPDRVASLILANAQIDAAGWQASNIDHVNAEVRALYPEVWQRLQELREQGVLSRDERYQRLLGPALEVLEWRSPDHPALTRVPDYAFDLDTYLAFLGEDPEWVVGGTLRGHDVLTRLRPRRLPTLLIAGRHDRVTVPAIAHSIAARLDADRTSLHVFESSAHRPWAEEPEAFFGVVERFLAQPGATGGHPATG